MASRSHLGVDEKIPRARSASPSPSRKKKGNKLARSLQQVKDHDIFLLPASDYQILAGLLIVAIFVRLFRIYEPTSVVFDEVHFGGFASKYIKGRFFMDVHPPLAKLLITLAGWLAGFDGDFDFKDIGKDYLEPGVPYVAMRMLPALCGIATIPTIFLTLKAAGCATFTATLGAGLIIFENALVTQSRLILLDSPLVIFTAFTALAWTSFINVHEQGPSQAFSPNWWFWLLMTGLGLGATASVKWVGLFTIAWVGSLTILQLWFLLGDTVNVTPRVWTKHFLARAYCLIGIPIGFYMLMFAIHLTCLVNPGDGDGFMSSEFQSTLNNKGMQDVPADVAFGSRVSIRHHNTQGGYLHSHSHMYPTGSKQQQITLYPHKDENNVFVMENQTNPEDGVGIGGFDAISPPVFIENGAFVRLYHATTHRRLHSHDVRPPVTEAEWQNEVSAYGYEGFDGDANDVFRVEIVPHMSDGAVAKQRLRTIESKFRLVHTLTGCVLFSHKVKLPDWGFEQQEVTCAKGGTLPNSIWYIEGNEHPQLKEDAELVNYRRPGFFAKFWELQKVMWTTNAGLVESHAWDSRPPSWPILRRGINFWGKDHRQVYLIGNPLIWWSSTAAIGVYVAFKALALLRWQRGYRDYSVENFRRFDYEVGVAVLAWAFHYFPFYLMQRQLFLHHYLPALYFAVIVLCQIFDFVTARISMLRIKDKPIVGWSLAVVFLTVTAVVFSLYSPLAYGNPWTKSQCNRVKLFNTWDWDCNTFYDSYADYSNGGGSVIGTQAPSEKVDYPAAPSSVEAPEQVVTPQQYAPEQLLSHEEKVEYRDQDGNILNEEQVRALEGQVAFETKYETKYRILDEQGNVVSEETRGHGVDGANPETVGVEGGDAEVPRSVEAEAESKEAEGRPSEASPASEGAQQETK